MAERHGGELWAYPDTLVGTDSHTTMINGLGVLGWGVGGIEAEAAMLGQPISMLIPQVVGFRLTGELAEGATATDLVLTVTQMLRKRGVVGKFVEFFGPGLGELRARRSRHHRQHGARVRRHLRHLPGRPGRPRLPRASAAARPSRSRWSRRTRKEQGLFHDESTPDAEYTDTLELDLGTVEPSLAGPRRPQDRVALSGVKPSFALRAAVARRGQGRSQPRAATVGRWEAEAGGTAVAEETAVEIETEVDGVRCRLRHGSVVIAAITSCTNTSNPSVMLAAGLLAKKAVARGLTTQAAGSRPASRPARRSSPSTCARPG